MDTDTGTPVCYRHPDRPTRVSCTSCERPICVECMHSASVGQKCPECAAPVGRAKVITASDVQRQARRASAFSYTVIGVCAAIFVIELVVPGAPRIIRDLGAQINPLVAAGQWWRLLTATLLHAGLMHVGFNMYALYLFGPPLEREVGTLPFATLYVSGALAGGVLFFLLVPNGQAIGASGAVFALFGAWLVASFRNRHTLQGRANLRSLLLLLAINLGISFFPGIAWQAHLGGLVAGAVIMLGWFRVAQHPRALLLRTAVAGAVGILALVAAFAL